MNYVEGCDGLVAEVVRIVWMQVWSEWDWLGRDGCERKFGPLCF